MLIRTAPARGIRLTGLPIDADAARSAQPTLMSGANGSVEF